MNNAVATVVIVLAVLAASVAGGWFVTRGVLTLAARNAPPAVDLEPGDVGSASTSPVLPRHAESAGPTSARAVAALRGGTWIGLLERFVVTGLILVGYPAGIAILVAVKGLGRYPELQNNPEASERFVIGTLASMVWAGSLGILGAWLIR